MENEESPPVIEFGKSSVIVIDSETKWEATKMIVEEYLNNIGGS